jgi:hypothetical protein
VWSPEPTLKNGMFVINIVQPKKIMKKLLVGILVLASMIACTSQETKKADASVDKGSGTFTSLDKKSAIIKELIEGYLTGDTAINYPLVRTYYSDTVKVFQHKRPKVVKNLFIVFQVITMQYTPI